MPRKAVHLSATRGAIFGRQAIWQAIRARAGKRFAAIDIERAADEHGDTVATYLQSLTKAGIIRVVEKRIREERMTNFYELVKDVGIEAPRVRRDGSPCKQGLPREQMWRTMQQPGVAFTWRDLAAMASTDDVPVSAIDAKHYIVALLKAGYLTVVKASKPGSAAVYRLTLNTGPRPPMVQRLKTVFDQNRGKVMWREGVRE